MDKFRNVLFPHFPGGCAFFNTDGKGNIDRKECKALGNMTCSSKPYHSDQNTKRKFI